MANLYQGRTDIRHSAFDIRHSPIANLQSPISNLQSPISNRSSPICNQESPFIDPVGVQPDHDEEQDCKTPKGGTSVAEKGQRDTDGGQEPKDHSYVDGEMKEEYGYGGVAENHAEGGFLTICNVEQPDQEAKKQ